MSIQNNIRSHQNIYATYIGSTYTSTAKINYFKGHSY